MEPIRLVELVYPFSIKTDDFQTAEHILLNID